MIRLRLRRVVSGASVLAGFVVGCSLTTSLDGLTGGTPSSDGGGTDGIADASADQTSDAASCGGPTTLASTGAVSNASGLAMQTHVVYASHAAQWWLFYIDSADPALLKTRFSADFCTWTDGAPLTLPHTHANEGRNFSVAYADLGGADIVHITFSHLVDASHRYHTHTRAKIAASSITYDAPVQVSAYQTTTSYPIDPDGPVNVVGTDGTVTDLSAWIDEGGGHIDDALAWRSTTPDTGGAWTDAWSPFTLITYVDNVVNARAVAPLIGGGVLTLWENGSAEPDPDNLGFSVWNGSGWSAAAQVFPTDKSQGVDDWSILTTAVGVHAVRRTATNDFEHLRFDGSTWQAGGALANDPGAHDSGIVLASTGAASMSLYAIGQDGSIRSATWNGTAWSAWSSVVPTGATRTFLSGATLASGKAAVLWTEAGATNFTIVGMLVPPS